MKCKLFTSVIAVVVLYAMTASAFPVRGLQCSAGADGPIPSSFVLYRRQPGETVYTPFLEQPTCNFDTEVVETGETCFKYAAKNVAGVSVRNDTTICVDPRNATLPPPNTLGVK